MESTAESYWRVKTNCRKIVWIRFGVEAHRVISSSGSNGGDNREKEATNAMHSSLLRLLFTSLTIPVLSFPLWIFLLSSSVECLSQHQLLQHMFNFSLVLKSIPPVWKTIWFTNKQHHGLAITPTGFSWFLSKLCQVWHNKTGTLKNLHFHVCCWLSTLQTNDVTLGSCMYNLMHLNCAFSLVSVAAVFTGSRGGWNRECRHDTPELTSITDTPGPCESVLLQKPSGAQLLVLSPPRDFHSTCHP